VDEKTIKEPGKVGRVYLYRPPHVVPRITMQQGCFTVHPDNYMERVINWIDGPKIKFIIQAEDKADIREGLYAAGINRAALFPDLDGIALHLKETIDATVDSCHANMNITMP
jgi:hypothetical protein